MDRSNQYLYSMLSNQPGTTNLGFNTTPSNPYGIGASNFGTNATPGFGTNVAGTTNFGTNATPGFATNLGGTTNYGINTTPGFGTNVAGTTNFGINATPGFQQIQAGNNNFGTNPPPGFAPNATFNTSTMQSPFAAVRNPTPFGIQQRPNPFGITTTPNFNQVNNNNNSSISTGSSFFNQLQATTFQTTPNQNLFNSTTGFNPTVGTPVKFTPILETDTVFNKGMCQTIRTRINCITVMQEYRNKSLEELRFEDYQAGRKGTQVTGFGIPNQLPGVSTTNTNVTTNLGTSTGGFMTVNQPNTGLFNKPATGFTLPSANNNFSFNPTTTSNPFTANKSLTSSTNLFSTNLPFNSQNTGPFNNLQPSQNTGFFSQNRPIFNWPTQSTTTGTPFGPGLKYSENPFVTDSRTPLLSTNSASSGTSFFNQQQHRSLFGPSPFSSSVSTMPLYRTNQTYSTSFPTHEQILALAITPFGDDPLLRNLPAARKVETLEKLKSVYNINRGISNNHYKISTNNSVKIKPKAVTLSTQKNLFNSLEDEDSALLEIFQIRPSAKRLVLRPKPLPNVSSIVANTSSDINRTSSFNESEIIDKENQDVQSVDESGSTSSTSWLKSTINNKKSQEDSRAEQSDVFIENIDNTIIELRPSLSRGDQLDLSSINLSDVDFSNLDKRLDSIATSSDTTERASSSSEKIDDAQQSSEGIAKLAQVTLRRSGYYTIPSLVNLDEYVHEKTCLVRNLIIGRRGYGQVFFPGLCDIFGLNLDEIVHFRHKEVVIYPDDNKKPPIGQGLNREAQITLDRVWPQDESLNVPIRDPKRIEELNYVEKLIRVSDKHNTAFLEYRAETGSWVFKVQHF